MKIYKNTYLNKKHHNGVIAIGNFDALHLGHQKVIKEGQEKAKKNKLPLVVKQMVWPLEKVLQFVTQKKE